MIWIIIYIIFAIVTEILTYKWLRRIDKKERKFLKQWEIEYIESYKDLWRQSYFEKLAEEIKMKKIEDIKKQEQKETNEQLKQVNIDEEFKKVYDVELQNAIDKLEKEEKEK